MTCDDYKHALHEYFMGRATPEEIQRLEAHRQQCADCDGLMQLALETTCKDVTEFLADYIDETLTGERREVFERHLSICPDCSAYLQSYRATMGLSVLAMKPAMRRLADEMPESLVDGILEALAAERKKTRGPH